MAAKEAFSSAMERAKSSVKKVVGMKADIAGLESLSGETVRSLNKTQLKEVLKTLGLPRTGNVADLRDRVLRYKRSKQEPTAEGKEDEEDEVLKTRGLGDVRDLRDRMLDHKSSRAAEGKEDEVGGEVSASTVENKGSNVKVGSNSAVGDLKSNKKKKWGMTDPARIAPNCYHRDVFAANFPMVKIVDVPPGAPFPVPDKFEGNLLDAEATAEARKRWIRRCFEVDHTYGMAENEQMASPQQFAFLESLMQFTIPAMQDVQMHNERCANLKRRWSYEEVQVERKRRKLDAYSEHNAGFRIVPHTEEAQDPLGPNRSDSDEGMKLVREEVAKLTGDLEEDLNAVTGFADGVVHVMDYRPQERAVRNSIYDLNPDRVVAILERKFAEDLHKWNARFQGGFYAVKHCMVNLQRGHGAPVYVLVMTSSLWSYGILVPEGYIQIRDGNIDFKCLPDFQRHQALTGVCVSKTGLDELQERLKEGTDFYRRNYRENPHAHYADGPMLVGTYYLSPRWFSLPKPEPGNGKLEAVRRLFDGLMRLVLGDSVIDLKSEDYEWRWQLRERMLREEIDIWC